MIKGYSDIPECCKELNSLSNILIPSWLIRRTPDVAITLRKFSIPILVGSDYYSQRCAEIEYEVSEKEFYYP